MKIDTNSIKRILIIQPRGLGDIVLSTVVVKNLKKDIPEANIDYITQYPFNTALEKNPLINEIISFKPKNIQSTFSALRRIRKNRYDLVIDFLSIPRTALMTFISGARYRAGKAAKGRRYAYNIKRIEPDSSIIHQVDRNLAFLQQLGISHDATELLFGIGDDDIRYADEFFLRSFDPEDFIIGICPAGKWQSRKCLPEKLAGIADALAETYGAKILLIWGPAEQHEALEIQRLMNNDCLLAPKTNITEMGAFVSKCSMVVSNNSAPMHIAVAVKTPVLSIEGPTNPERQGPYGPMHESIRLEELDCIGCHRRFCPKNLECYRDLPIEHFMEKAGKLIEKNNLKISHTIKKP